MSVRPAAAPRESLTIRPEPPAWRSLVAAAPLDPSAQRFREQLGLPIHRPVIMTGHQAEFWHPGILAKYLAADAAARALNAAAAWLVVDQDTSDAGAVRYPARRPDGGLAAELWTPDPDSPPTPETPAMARPPLRPGAVRLPEQAAPASASVLEGLERIARALRAHAGSPTLGVQAAAALRDLLAELIDPAPTVLASGLARTDLFADVVARMEREPERAVRSYNAAAAAHPHSGIRPLVADEVNDRYELPLWRIERGRPRRRVYAEDLPAIPLGSLAPRALLMTGLLRRAGCELFIHGTGGGGTAEHEGYDAVTERWLGEWLGWQNLGPVAVVTATRHLPLGADTLPSPEEAAHAAWLAHRARHDPAILGDEPAAERKRSLVAQIRKLKGTGDPAPAFAELHTLLAQVGRRSSGRLAQLDLAARQAKDRLRDAAVLFDRTWAFPLYPDRTLADLRDQVGAAFADA